MKILMKKDLRIKLIGLIFLKISESDFRSYKYSEILNGCLHRHVLLFAYTLLNLLLCSGRDPWGGGAELGGSVVAPKSAADRPGQTTHPAPNLILLINFTLEI